MRPTGPSLRGRLAVFFAESRGRLVEESAADPEPETRFSAEWNDWQRRHWDRQRHAGELAEAEALSSFPEDPAPLASEGLEVFLKWEKRQEGRRIARGGFKGRRIA